MSKSYFHFIINLLIANLVYSTDIDPLGYLMYCPCMGRFGNQADHFLGAFAFAHGLNRTLVLPPWVEYRYGEARSIQVPFSKYFQIKPLQTYHKVLTMEAFMETIAATEWPKDKRISFCYRSRGNGSSCNAKEGNPFGPFWDTFDVNFVGSEFYGPLHYDIHHHNIIEEWKKKYPADLWPVLAFTGAPATFPVQLENRKLHKYLKWSAAIEEEAASFIEAMLPKGAFIGIHLRNGIDWVKACDYIKHSPNFFASPQCLGYRNEKGRATMDMCLPSVETIIRQIKRAIKSYNNKEQHLIKSVFVASDNNHMITELTDALKRMKIGVFKYYKSNPHIDLAILGRSNIFIGNCISSYSAFVKRERDVNGFVSLFWGFPPDKSVTHDEL